MNEKSLDTSCEKSGSTNSDCLNTRLLINKKYQSRDFHNWLHKRLNVYPGEHILDVGCGTGAQSLRFLDIIGNNGSVSSFDISQSSIDTLLKEANGDKRLEATVADMADIEVVIKKCFSQKNYTLAHSSYALYYSPSHKEVLKQMVNAIYSHGRVAVFTPVGPHGMVEIAKKFSQIPKSVIESLDFGPKILESQFRSLFWDVEIHYFQSEMNVTSTEDFMNFYRATTYFNLDASKKIQKYAENEIKNNGAICYEKNGYLIIGRDKK